MNKSIISRKPIILKKLYLKKLPQFLNKIKVLNNFNCAYNKLTSLSNCPQYIKDTFSCHFNKLKSLEGGPQIIIKIDSDGISHFQPRELNYNCFGNKLTTLKGSPKAVKGFDCSYNNLTTLKYCPIILKSPFGSHYFNYEHNTKLLKNEIKKYVKYVKAPYN